MKKILLLFATATLFALPAFPQRGYPGEKGVSSIGIISGYAVENKAFAAGLDFRYNILDRLRLAPSVYHVLKSDSLGASTWYANIDAHYLARVSGTVTIYPIVGAGVSVWKYKLPAGLEPEEEEAEETGEEDDAAESAKKENTTSEVRMGLNLGVGVEKRLTKDIILGVEFKYNLTTERIYNQAMLLGRIAYYF
jgi:opacity protein-like surface antigen